LQHLCREMCRLQNSHTRDREIHLLELKVAHSIMPESRPSRTPVAPKSGLLGPFRPNDHMGEGVDVR
jgi:hypothetical protein